MATYRVHKTRDYTVMSNTHLRDKTMSLKAKGLLSVMLSLPESWDYSLNGLVAISRENTTAIRAALGELETLGYLVRERKQNAKGRFEYEYHIYEMPQLDALRADKPYTENPHTDKPHTENSRQLNTDLLNTKQSNTDRLSTDKEIYNAVVSYLNKKAGTNFRASSKATQQKIHARIEEGFTETDFYVVIDKKCNQWLNDPKMCEYLRPETLFGTKFESYLNAPETRNVAPSGAPAASGNVFLEIAREEGLV